MKDAAAENREAAMDRRLGDWVVFFLAVIGVWLVVAPWFAENSGYAWAAGKFGGEAGLLRFLTGFLFLYFAGLVKEKNRLRHTLAGMVQLIREHLGNRPRGLAAVDILVEALERDGDPAVKAKIVARLEQMSGEKFGADAAAWRRWWEAHRPTGTE